MNEEELSSGMRVLADDVPDPPAIESTMRSKIGHRQKTRRTVMVTVAAAAVAAIAVGATTIGAGFFKDARPGSGAKQDSVQSSSFRCYATANLNVDGARNYLPVSIVSKDGKNVPAGSQAIEVCAQHWAEKALSTTPPYIHDQPSKNGYVPQLVACVLPDVLSDESQPEVAVFPGTDTTCNELKLEKYAG